MDKNFIFSSESVGEGHPDKVADYISDSILDACLTQNPASRVACETMVKSNCVYLSGEITSEVRIDYDAIVRQAIQEIGYIHDDDVFHPDKVFISNAITKQSTDIASGIDTGGAGDQGIMFGYACNDTEELMPAPIIYAHRLTRELAHARKHFAQWIRPDCKTQVAVRYEDRKPVEITNIVLSTQHTADMSHRDIVDFCREDIIKKVLPNHLLTKNTQYFINSTGRFVIGGPQGDAGLTGRKIMVDTYGGWAHHGGGCFSGKDPSKVDRSAAYMCRWIAKNIVAAGLASEVEIQVAYAIGHPEPTSLNLTTFGTGIHPDPLLKKAIESLFSFKPFDMIKSLNLLHPIYKTTTNYGHFTQKHFPWEHLTCLNLLSVIR